MFGLQAWNCSLAKNFQTRQSPKKTLTLSDQIIILTYVTRLSGKDFFSQVISRNLLIRLLWFELKILHDLCNKCSSSFAIEMKYLIHT